MPQYGPIVEHKLNITFQLNYPVSLSETFHISMKNSCKEIKNNCEIELTESQLRCTYEI